MRDSYEVTKTVTHETIRAICELLGENPDEVTRMEWTPGFVVVERLVPRDAATQVDQRQI